ncbi:MAG: MFS transporter [Halobacteriales archaeon]
MTDDSGDAQASPLPAGASAGRDGPDGDAGTDGGERLLSGRAGRLLVATSLGWMAIQAGRLVLSPMLTAVMADLQITEFQAGIPFTIMWGLYAVMQFPSGRLSDRLSRTSLLVPGVALVAVGFLALSAAPTYPLFLLGATVVGAGAGLYPTAARALLSDLFVAKRGRAFGFHTASGDVGGAAAAALSAVVLAVATWQAAYLPVVAVLAVVLALLHRYRPAPYRFRRVPLEVRATARRLLGNRRLAALLGAYVLFAFTWQGVVSFLPTFLQKAKAFPPGLAGGGFAALFVVGAVVKPVAGSLGDRAPKPAVAAGALALGLVSLSTVLVAEATAVVAVAVVGFAAGLMSFPPVMQAYLMDVFPDASMGGDLGGARTVYIGLGSLGPTYVGFVAGTAGYVPAFAGLGGLLLVTAVVVLAIGR